MPKKYLNAIMDQIDATYNGQHWLVDCATRNDLPNIEFYFGEAKIVFTLEDYSWKYFVSIILQVKLHFKNLVLILSDLNCFFFQDECQIGFSEFNEFLFGSLIFFKATIILDRDNDRVGFADIR